MIIISAHWTVSALNSNGDPLGAITAVLWLINERMSALRGGLHKGIFAFFSFLPAKECLSAWQWKLKAQEKASKDMTWGGTYAP